MKRIKCSGTTGKKAGLMRTNWLRGTCVAGLVIAGTALAQSPDITSFHGNGSLTWTNSNTNLFYRIEWSPSLTAPAAWHTNYSALTDIRSSASIVTSSVPMFYRICGSSNRLVYAAPTPKTGQTLAYQTGDNGYYTNGVVWPNPRFSVQVDPNCVLDNLTGLMWARNANQAGYVSLANAIAFCTNLTWGGYQDWRVPNVRELQSLLDFGQSGLILPAGNPFLGVQPDHYWSSTTTPWDGTVAYIVHLGYGRTIHDYKSNPWVVWPVRGGQ